MSDRKKVLTAGQMPSLSKSSWDPGSVTFGYEQWQPIIISGLKPRHKGNVELVTDTNLTVWEKPNFPNNRSEITGHVAGLHHFGAELHKNLKLNVYLTDIYHKGLIQNRITEYPEMEGTHQDHWIPTLGPAQDNRFILHSCFSLKDSLESKMLRCNK